MKVYIARQPIYNSDKSLFGYELLYRNSDKNAFANINEDKATKELTYNILSEFDLYKLTNNKYGSINFTKESLISDLPLLFDPNNIIIEILENVELDEAVMEKIKFFKEKKYILALDDFIDDGTYEEILPYIDIIKVEYNLLDPEIRKNIVIKYKKNKQLVAERIETEEEYNSAVNDGYELFQGYYFSKPIMLSKSSINIASSTYLRLWKEISKEDASFDTLENIIKLDAGLTYKLFTMMNTPVYYRGNEIKSIKQALLRLGMNETKKWIMLLFLKDITKGDNDRFASQSLVRAMFMEKLIIKIGHKKIAQDAYMVGLLSMIDNILKEDMLSIFDELHLSDNIKKSLINREGILFESLECIRAYGQSDWNKVDDFCKLHNLNKDDICSIYLDSLKYADDMFKINNK